VPPTGKIQARSASEWISRNVQIHSLALRATKGKNLRTPRKFWDRSVFSFQFSVFSRESPLSFSDEMSLNGNGSFSDRGDVKKKAPTSRSTKSLEICVIV
jgi:hypothetical protein